MNHAAPDVETNEVSNSFMYIVKAKPNDAAILSEISKSTFVETFGDENDPSNMAEYLANTFSIEKQLAEINDSKRKIEIAWRDKTAIGFLHLKEGPAEPCVNGFKPVELLRLYVCKPWLGRGVGAALLNRSIEIARAEKFLTLWLGVWEKNQRARRFYEKFQFHQVGQHIFRLGKEDQVDLILERSLKQN